MDLQNRHFIGHLPSDRNAVLMLDPASTGNRPCLPPKPGTGADGSPGLKMPSMVNQSNDIFWKWWRFCDQFYWGRYLKWIEGFIRNVDHSIFIKHFTKESQNQRETVKGMKAKGLPRHVELLTDSHDRWKYELVVLSQLPCRVNEYKWSEKREYGRVDSVDSD